MGSAAKAAEETTEEAAEPATSAATTAGIKMARIIASPLSQSLVVREYNRARTVFWQARTAPAKRVMGRVRCPSTNNPASYRADSWAETVGRCGATDAPLARTGAVLETSVPAAVSGFPCADCTVNRPRPRFPTCSGRLCCAG